MIFLLLVFCRPGVQTSDVSSIHCNLKDRHAWIKSQTQNTSTLFCGSWKITVFRDAASVALSFLFTPRFPARIR